MRPGSTDETRWLRDLDPDAVLSFAPRAWPADSWVLHGMWEEPAVAPEPIEPASGRSVIVEVVGFASPPHGWRRLRWRELAERLDAHLAGTYEGRLVPPCFRWFDMVWPATIWPPSEGSLDRPTGDRLISLLTEHTEGGADAPCVVYYSGAGFPFGEWEPTVLLGPLRAVLDAARHSGNHTVTPDNIWPVDRSWLITTDYDLWGTRVAGSTELVAALEADPELETIRWDHPVLSR